MRHVTCGTSIKPFNFSFPLRFELKNYDYNSTVTAVITIKHISTFLNNVENPFNYIQIFDLIDKCRYVFYGYDGSHCTIVIIIFELKSL